MIFGLFAMSRTELPDKLETEEELKVLNKLGIKYGQGFFLGRPADCFIK